MSAERKRQFVMYCMEKQTEKVKTVSQGVSCDGGRREGRQKMKREERRAEKRRRVERGERR